jgi:hypothetical protein
MRKFDVHARYARMNIKFPLFSQGVRRTLYGSAAFYSPAPTILSSIGLKYGISQINQTKRLNL